MTHYVEKLSLIESISISYPGLQISIIGYPELYSNIDWNGNTPILESDINTTYLTVYRNKVLLKIRDDASKARLNMLVSVLGTTDQEQIRTYEEKYAEAVAYIADNLVATPMLTNETAQTGETMEYLSNRVVSEYTYAKNILRQQYGTLEGIRRKANAAAAIATLTELENFTPPFIGYV